MQMTAKAKRQLQMVLEAHNWRHGRRDKGVSYATMDDRAHTLFLCFRQLYRDLNLPCIPRGFRGRHARALVAHWEAQGLSAATLQKRFSYLNTFCRWIGKAGMLEGSVGDYLKDPGAGRHTEPPRILRRPLGLSHAVMADSVAAR